MRVTIMFDERADLSNQREIHDKCLATTEAATSWWPDDRTLTFVTTRQLSSVVDQWESEGFSFSEFRTVVVTP